MIPRRLSLHSGLFRDQPGYLHLRRPTADRGRPEYGLVLLQYASYGPETGAKGHTERICGVWVVNLQNGETVAFLRFEEGVQEIFAVQVLWKSRFPEMLEFGDPLINTSYVVPDEALRDVPMALKGA